MCHLEFGFVYIFPYLLKYQYTPGTYLQITLRNYANLIVCLLFISYHMLLNLNFYKYCFSKSNIKIKHSMGKVLYKYKHTICSLIKVSIFGCCQPPKGLTIICFHEHCCWGHMAHHIWEHIHPMKSEHCFQQSKGLSIFRSFHNYFHADVKRSTFKIRKIL